MSTDSLEPIQPIFEGIDTPYVEPTHLLLIERDKSSLRWVKNIESIVPITDMFDRAKKEKVGLIITIPKDKDYFIGLIALLGSSNIELVSSRYDLVKSVVATGTPLYINKYLGNVEL